MVSNSVAMMVLGLVSTKRPALESRDALLRRLHESGRFIAAERLARVVEVASEVWRTR